MDSGRVRAALVLVLAVAALATAGAAIQSDTGGGDSPGAGEGEGLGFGGGEDAGVEQQPPPEGGDGGGWIGYLFVAAALGGVVFGVAFLVQALFNWSLEQLLAFLRSAAGRLLAAGVLFAIAYLMVQFLPDFAGGGESGGLLGTGEGAGAGGAESTGVDLPLGGLAGVAGLLFLLVLYAIHSARSEEAADVDPPDATDPPEEGVRSAKGGGGTAASPGGVPADNEVYRTWLALADAADADPRRHSPGTVAQRAREAGIDETAIQEATSLFETVRYGGQRATDDRERRARELRETLTGASSS